MSSSKKIVLRSSDGETFDVDEIVAVESQTIKHMIEDDCADTVIPLPNVTSAILSKVIEYCKMHVETDDKDSKVIDDTLKTWDAEFVKVDQNTLFDLILVSSFFPISLWNYDNSWCFSVNLIFLVALFYSVDNLGILDCHLMMFCHALSFSHFFYELAIYLCDFFC